MAKASHRTDESVATFGKTCIKNGWVKLASKMATGSAGILVIYFGFEKIWRDFTRMWVALGEFKHL